MSPTQHPAPVAEPVALFKALADPVRLDLLIRIIDVPEMSCTQLVNDAEVSASTVSYHMKLLKAAGLIGVRKEGRNFFYAARADALGHLQDLFAELAATCRKNKTEFTGETKHSA